MNDSQLNRRLNSIGMGCFTEYFHLFSDLSLTRREVAEILCEETGYTRDSCGMRTRKARSIINSGLALNALERVCVSRAKPRIREDAARLACSLRQQQEMPDASGNMPNGSGNMPDASNGMANASGDTADGSGNMPDASNGMANASGDTADGSGNMPNGSGNMADASNGMADGSSRD